MAAKGRSLNFSHVINKFTGYISSYASSTASWLTYPYYGISSGVLSIIVIFIVTFLLILGQLYSLVLH